MVVMKSRQKEQLTPVSTRDLRGENSCPVVAVIGVGYVGAHLVNVFSSSVDVIGYDISSARIAKLRSESLQSKRVRFTSNSKDLKSALHFLIAVPTTLGPDGNVNLSHVESALEIVERYARRNSVVVIESTVAIGTTRRLLEPLAKSRRIFAGMSPEV